MSEYGKAGDYHPRKLALQKAKERLRSCGSGRNNRLVVLGLESGRGCRHAPLKIGKIGEIKEQRFNEKREHPAHHSPLSRQRGEKRGRPRYRTGVSRDNNGRRNRREAERNIVEKANK